MTIKWDTEEIYLGMPTININFTDKILDTNTGILSEKLLVRPHEQYSYSIYCKTSDYTLLDGTDPQVVLFAYRLLS